MAMTAMNMVNGGGEKNCKSGTTKNGGSFTPSTSAFTEIELGFVPTSVAIWLTNNANTLLLFLDVVNNKKYWWYQSNSGAETTAFDSYVLIDGTTLKYKAASAGYAVATNYMAIKE